MVLSLRLVEPSLCLHPLNNKLFRESPIRKSGPRMSPNRRIAKSENPLETHCPHLPPPALSTDPHNIVHLLQRNQLFPLRSTTVLNQQRSNLILRDVGARKIEHGVARRVGVTRRHDDVGVEVVEVSAVGFGLRVTDDVQRVLGDVALRPRAPAFLQSWL